MDSPKGLTLVAAMAANRVIGNGPDVPWNLPGDQEFFQRITSGKLLAMGRKTYETLITPLPNKIIVITRQENYTAPGCTVVSTIEAAQAIAEGLKEELYVVGGAEIYALALPLTRRIFLTEIHQTFSGDAFFPELDPAVFTRVESIEVDGPIPYALSTYERVCG